MAIALGATVVLAGDDGEREAPVAALYRDDGIDYLAKQPHEVVTEIRMPVDARTSSAYVKLRRRGSIDFPIAGAAVAVELDGDVVDSCRIVLSAVASHPLEATAAGEFLAGKRLDHDVIQAAADLAAKPARPLDNADLTHFWRKRMVRVVVEQAILDASAGSGVDPFTPVGRARRLSLQANERKDHTATVGPGHGRIRAHPRPGGFDRDRGAHRHRRSGHQPVLRHRDDDVQQPRRLLTQGAPTRTPGPIVNHSVFMIHFFRWTQEGQGMVEYALILALVALIVIVALIATGGQLINVYSNITATMCNFHVGC